MKYKKLAHRETHTPFHPSPTHKHHKTRVKRGKKNENKKQILRPIQYKKRKRRKLREDLHSIPGNEDGDEGEKVADEEAIWEED